jgi:hypothetical protein
LTDAAAEVSAKAIFDGRKVRDSRVTTIHPTAHSARDRRFRRKPIFITRACFCEEFRLRPYLEMDAAFARFR